MALTNKYTTRTKKPEIPSLIYGKIAPQATELEGAVLGAIMLEPQKLAEVLEIIQSPECFYSDANQRIYASIRRLFDKGTRIDFMTVCEDLRKNNELEMVGGSYYVTSLTRDVVSATHIEEHARIVMQKYILRELIRMSGEIIGEAYENSSDVFDLLDKAETNLYEITDKHLRKNFSSINSILSKTIHEIEQQANKKEDLTGVASGYIDLDRVTSGWQKTDLIILAARPAVGKTAFALNLVMNAALNTKQPTGVAFFSLEMSAGQLVKRMLSAVTDVPLGKITKGQLAEHEIVQIHQRMGKLASANIFIDDQAALNIFELRAKCRRLKQKYNIGLVIIDYLQLMQGSIEKGGNRQEEVSKISRDLKGLAKELEIPIIALSQLNRGLESRKDNAKMPQLSDLRESGAIEQDADMVMFLYRPDYHGLEKSPDGDLVPGETWINIAKHRNGKTDVVKVQAKLDVQRFEDMPNIQSFAIPNEGMPSTGNPKFGFKRNFGEGPNLAIEEGYEKRTSKVDNYKLEDDEFNPKNDFDEDDLQF
ncbi:MAG: replicative DNA helicase [Chitinophagaceae bacterium]|nr:replicative DNA helicase [Chitinophagaceae bacterium]HMN32579.1 replicative DNA helicase [Chitinophagaceae bacterium]